MVISKYFIRKKHQGFIEEDRSQTNGISVKIYTFDPMQHKIVSTAQLAVDQQFANHN